MIETNEYEINSETFAVIPVTNNVSHVLEGDKDFIINKSTIRIIDDSCKYFGSSYIGRIDGTKNILGTTTKVPIIIEESNSIIYFPTLSPRNNRNTWISLNNIREYYRDDNNTKVIFKNGENLCLDVSYYSFDNQVLRATRLEALFKRRKNDFNNKKMD